MIIGITGTKASGKGEVAEILKKNGYVYSSLSDRVREEVISRGNINYTIKDLQDMGNELREKFGLGVLARKTLELVKGNGNVVIDGIRNPGEIEELKKFGDFSLIAVDAHQEKRFERLIKRARLSDPKTWDEFLEMDKRDLGDKEQNIGQQVEKCIELANYKIENNGTIEDLHKEIENVLMEISNQKYKRPSWDEYFMEIARTIAKRATCDRGRSGCVIARNKQILVSGYVGSPVGVPHCDEIGHQMKTVIHEDGTSSQHCMRTAHAEQNAICQAAKLGVPIEGATLYCKMTPCSSCAKMIINSGIKRVVAEKRYHQGKESEELFKCAGVKLEIIDENIETYKNQ